jgi:hypothetical protein
MLCHPSSPTDANWRCMVDHQIVCRGLCLTFCVAIDPSWLVQLRASWHRQLSIDSSKSLMQIQGTLCSSAFLTWQLALSERYWSCRFELIDEVGDGMLVVVSRSAPCRCDCCCTTFDFVIRNLHVLSEGSSTNQGQTERFLRCCFRRQFTAVAWIFIA